MFKSIGICFTVLFISISIAVFGTEPPRYKKQFFSKEGIVLTTISQWALRHYSTNLVHSISAFSEHNKLHYIDSNTFSTVAFILYEFATGEGPCTRYFTNNQPFSNSIKNGPGVKWVLKQYMDSLQKSDIFPSFCNYRYQFSALINPLQINTWAFSFKQHYKVLKSGNLAQMALGSYNVDIIPQADSSFRVHIWNLTSKKSLFLGLGNRVQRPKPLGTIKQHIFFTLSWSEAMEIAAN